MLLSTDNSEYLYARAAEARDLQSQSRDDTIRQALSDIAESYETMAKRAERTKGVAKPTRLLLALPLAVQWFSELADAVVY
jgi:hypothetical protein